LQTKTRKEKKRKEKLASEGFWLEIYKHFDHRMKRAYL
jgi:hypothetical protein